MTPSLDLSWVLLYFPLLSPKQLANSLPSKFVV
jgi:hypothetical protein